MKNTFLALILLAVLVSAGAVLAESASPLPSAGATPDSSFYFLKAWKEQIQLFFTFKAENKVKQYLHLTDVRLAEYQKMLEKGKTDIAQKTLEKYQAQLDRATALAEKLQLKKQSEGKDLVNSIQEKIANQVQILQRNIAKAPEAAKKGLNNALDRINEIIKGRADKENEENEGGEEEKGCTDSGGRAITSLCCKSTDDFPNMCLIGACGCSLDNSEETKICDCGPDKCFDGKACVAVGQ
ncbi:MAG: DUF5667 domain-containing protein [bacterium]|nr:DUF5667 domain-containing protein [bacterium]